MSAKEMFKELGYKERKEEFKDDKIYAITFANYSEGNWIIITKKTIEIVTNRNRGYLSTSMLPAINKQIEELGWNK